MIITENEQKYIQGIKSKRGVKFFKMFLVYLLLYSKKNGLRELKESELLGIFKPLNTREMKVEFHKLFSWDSYRQRTKEEYESELRYWMKPDKTFFDYYLVHKDVPELFIVDGDKITLSYMEFDGEQGLEVDHLITKISEFDKLFEKPKKALDNHCVVCGKLFERHNNKQKYCPDCKAEVHKKQMRDAVRLYRSM